MRSDIRPGGIFPDYALPDHTGTSVFLLLPFLMIDRADRDNRASAARYTAPLLCLILCAGQISDRALPFITDIRWSRLGHWVR